MSAIRFALLCALSIFFFSQVVLSRADGTEEGSLKSVEAKISVAVDDLKKAFGDVMQNLTETFNAEIAKHPGASEVYKNITESLSGVAKQVQDALSTVTPKP